MITEQEYHQFIAELESGNHIQTQKQLYNPNTDGYCCLGIFRAKIQGFEQELKDRDYSYVGTTWATDNEINLDIYEAINDTLGNHTCTTLAEMNDGGSSFADIALWLRDNKKEVGK